LNRTSGDAGFRGVRASLRRASFWQTLLPMARVEPCAAIATPRLGRETILAKPKQLYLQVNIGFVLQKSSLFYLGLANL
jgi:hypothetical protein